MQTQTIRLRGIAVAAAVTATYLVVGAYVNLPLREALKRAVGGVPYWLDHITFMLLAYLVVATLLAWKLVASMGAAASALHLEVARVHASDGAYRMGHSALLVWAAHADGGYATEVLDGVRRSTRHTPPMYFESLSFSR
jgi:type III secretory pathway component EscU